MLKHKVLLMEDDLRDSRDRAHQGAPIRTYTPVLTIKFLKNTL